MANLLQTPVSQLIKRGVGIGEVQEGRKTKDEYRKQKVFLHKLFFLPLINSSVYSLIIYDLVVKILIYWVLFDTQHRRIIFIIFFCDAYR